MLKQKSVATVANLLISKNHPVVEHAIDRDRREKRFEDTQQRREQSMWVCFRCCRDLPFCVVVVAAVVVAVVVALIFHSVLLLFLLLLS